MYVGSLSHRPLRHGIAPRLAVGGDADLERLHATVRRVLAGDVEQALDLADRAQVDHQLVRVARGRADELGMPDRGRIAIAGRAGFIAGCVAIGGEADSGVRGARRVRRRADPGEDCAVGRMIGALPSRAADVRQARRARGIGGPLPLRAPRLAEDQAALRLAEVHDLERRVVVDDQRVLARLRGVGRGDPQDGVIPVAFGARVPVLAGLVEERIDLVAEAREAQQPRPAEPGVGATSAGSSLQLQDGVGPLGERGVGLQRP